MSVEFDFDFSALYELGADLKRIGDETQPMAEAAVAKAAHDIEAHAKSWVPVDTGALMNSISTDVDGLSAEVGPTVNYGVYVEYGTYKMEPRPYMETAADTVEPQFLAAMEQIAGGEL